MDFVKFLRTPLFIEHLGGFSLFTHSNFGAYTDVLIKREKNLRTVFAYLISR